MTVELEQILRWVLILGFGAVFPIALYHRLKKRFGDDYRRYMDSTSRFFPGLGAARPAPRKNSLS